MLVELHRPAGAVAIADLVCPTSWSADVVGSAVLEAHLEESALVASGFAQLTIAVEQRCEPAR